MRLVLVMVVVGCFIIEAEIVAVVVGFAVVVQYV
jgi:hypothetical protein